MGGCNILTKKKEVIMAQMPAQSLVPLVVQYVFG